MSKSARPATVSGIELAAVLTTREVARAADLTPDAIRKLDKELRPLRTASGQRIYARVDVEAWLERRRTSKASAR